MDNVREIFTDLSVFTRPVEIPVQRKHSTWNDEHFIHPQVEKPTIKPYS